MSIRRFMVWRWRTHRPATAGAASRRHTIAGRHWGALAAALLLLPAMGPNAGVMGPGAGVSASSMSMSGPGADGSSASTGVPGTWSPTGSMSTPRSLDTATLLPSGQVLVVGGQDSNSNTLASAELYDPGTGTWTPTGSMLAPRAAHTATLLPAGQVLVAGGCAGSPCVPLASAELYNPSTGTWIQTGHLATARQNHTATLLSTGQVLVAGGCSGSPCTALASTELYDPATFTWTTTGSLSSPRENFTATLLSNGTVLAAGGGTNTAELYNPGAGTWAATGTMTGARQNHTATLLPNGQVLVAGGQDAGGTPLPSAELYDPGTGIWSATGNLNSARTNYTATLLPLAGGLVLVAGGVGSSGVTASAEVYDPGTATWAAVGSLSTARAGQTATLLPNGQVLAAGGSKGSGSLTSAELFAAGAFPLVQLTPSSLSFGDQLITITSLPLTITVTNVGYAPLIVSSISIIDPGAASFQAITTCTAGAVAPGDTCVIAVQFTPTTTGPFNVLLRPIDNAPTSPYQGALMTGRGVEGNAWMPTGSMIATRVYHTATLLPNGQVLVAGGQDAGGTPLPSTELYDPATQTWAATGNMTAARMGQTATLLPSGKVLVAGGCGGPGDCPAASAELFDPSTGTWTATGSMSVARTGHTATLLLSGRVLIAGGEYSQSPSSALASAELYDPGTGTWTLTGHLTFARLSHTATLLPNGQVLVAGGCNGNPCTALNSAELYDPSSSTWMPTGSMATARFAHTATLLSNGAVLVAGGCSGEACNSAELYSPSSGTWMPTGSMATARFAHTATLLSNGAVLVAGGSGNMGVTLANVETYVPSMGTWASVGSMTNARAWHTATLLPNGQVLVAGGCAGLSCTALNSAGRYLPVTLTLSSSSGVAGQSLTVTGTNFLAAEPVLLYWDSVTGSPVATATTDVAGSFTLTSTVPLMPFGTHTLIAAGQTSHTQATAAFSITPQVSLTPNSGGAGTTVVATGSGFGVLEPVALHWDAPTGPMLGTTTSSVQGTFTGTTAVSFTVPLSPTGSYTVYSLGLSSNITCATGFLIGPGPTPTPVPCTTPIPTPTNTPTPGPSATPTLTSAPSAVPTSTATPTPPAPTSTPAGAWTTTGSLITARTEHTATLLPNGKVLITGGCNGPICPNSLSSAEVYDPGTGTWTATASMLSVRTFHTATLLGNNKALVAGGATCPTVSTCTPLAGAELYDPATGTWAATGALGTARYDHTATLLPDGKLLIAGGCANQAGTFSFVCTPGLAGSELYDPATGTWTPTGAMTTARSQASATLLPNGTVLVAGGYDNAGNPLAGAEVYDPTSGTWTPTGAMTTPRGNHTATLLPNGTVLVAGGYDSLHHTTASAEVYDPHSGTWTPTGSMSTPRVYHTATLLPAGIVLVAGGCNGGDCTSWGNILLSSAEVYDPSTGTWSATGSMATARRSHTATLLPSGKVLVAGGQNLFGVVGTAELYTPSSPTPTSTPTPAPSATPTNTPTMSPAPPSSTPAPPTNTPVVLPSDTPVTPPSNTPVTPPSNIPQPTGAALLPPTTTPVTPPTNTPVTPPSNTPVTPPVTPPSATPAPRHPIGGYHPPVQLSLALRLAPARVASGDTLAIAIQTAPHARLTLSLQVTATRVVLRGSGKHRRHVQQRYVAYHVSAHGTADGRGHWTARLHITYRPARAVQAMLTVTARTTHSSTTRRVHVTIEPPRHGRSSHHTHR